MPQAEINYLAVLVAAVAHMVIGGVWYSPPVFGKLWMKLVGKTEHDIKKSNMAQLYLIAFAASLVMSYVLAHFVDFVGAKDVQGGLQAGFWLWLGFVATITIGQQLWEGKPWGLYLLYNAYHLLSLFVMGSVLAVWQ